MKELKELIKRVETEINRTPTSELRNLLCDVNIVLQQQALNMPVVSNRRELLIAFYKYIATFYINDISLTEQRVREFIEESNL